MHAVLQLTNFKVLGLALNRGPLTLPLSALQFATVLLAPITPQIGWHSAQQSRIMIFVDEPFAECCMLLHPQVMSFLTCLC
jgi:hypothetical protein